MVKKSDIRMGKTIQAQQSQMQRKRDQKQTEKEEAKLSVSDYLIQNEKKIHSRNTVIQCQKRSFLKVLQLGYQMVKLEKEAEAV